MADDYSAASAPRKENSWARVVSVGGWVSAFIVGAAALATALVTISAAFPKIFPFWAPFDASIVIRDIRVEKAIPTDAKFGGPSDEPAAELDIEYVEEKTGPSTLRECRPELKLQDVYSAQRSQTISDPTHAKISDKFLVRRAHYSKEGSLRMVCERRITGWTAFNLPEITGVNRPEKTTFHLCQGQYREACGGTPNWIPCEGNAVAWAKNTHPKECISVALTKLSDVGGNRCGYATFQVTCSTK